MRIGASGNNPNASYIHKAKNTGQFMGIITYEPMILENSDLITRDPLSYHQSLMLKEDFVWRSLANITLGRAINEWMKTLTGLTQKNYGCGIKRLMDLK